MNNKRTIDFVTTVVWRNAQIGNITNTRILVIIIRWTIVIIWPFSSKTIRTNVLHTRRNFNLFEMNGAMKSIRLDAPEARTFFKCDLRHSAGNYLTTITGAIPIYVSKTTGANLFDACRNFDFFELLTAWKTLPSTLR